MVNNEHLNNTFHALADPTRRHIIGMLVEQQEHRIKELVEPFEMSFAAVSKHINVLERAGLVTRNRRGRETFIQLNPEPLKNAQEWIDFYQQFWTQRFSKLKKLIAEEDGSFDQ